jgi:hypothetical protein
MNSKLRVAIMVAAGLCAVASLTALASLALFSKAAFIDTLP